MTGGRRAQIIEATARLIHETYECAVKQYQQTQGSRQISFDELPETDRKVMLAVAEAVVKRLCPSIPYFDFWQGACGHSWRLREHGPECPVCQVKAELKRAEDVVEAAIRLHDAIGNRCNQDETWQDIGETVIELRQALATYNRAKTTRGV